MAPSFIACGNGKMPQDPRRFPQANFIEATGNRRHSPMLALDHGVLTLTLSLNVRRLDVRNLRPHRVFCASASALPLSGMRSDDAQDLATALEPLAKTLLARWPVKAPSELISNELLLMKAICLLVALLVLSVALLVQNQLRNMRTSRAVKLCQHEDISSKTLPGAAPQFDELDEKLLLAHRRMNHTSALCADVLSALAPSPAPAWAQAGSRTACARRRPTWPLSQSGDTATIRFRIAGLADEHTAHGDHFTPVEGKSAGRVTAKEPWEPTPISSTATDLSDSSSDVGSAPTSGCTSLCATPHLKQVGDGWQPDGAVLTASLHGDVHTPILKRRASFRSDSSASSAASDSDDEDERVMQMQMTSRKEILPTSHAEECKAVSLASSSAAPNSPTVPLELPSVQSTPTTPFALTMSPAAQARVKAQRRLLLTTALDDVRPPSPRPPPAPPDSPALPGSPVLMADIRRFNVTALKAASPDSSRSSSVKGLVRTPKTRATRHWLALERLAAPSTSSASERRAGAPREGSTSSLMKSLSDAVSMSQSIRYQTASGSDDDDLHI